MGLVRVLDETGRSGLRLVDGGGRSLTDGAGVFLRDADARQIAAACESFGGEGSGGRVRLAAVEQVCRLVNDLWWCMRRALGTGEGQSVTITDDRGRVVEIECDLAAQPKGRTASPRDVPAKGCTSATGPTDEDTPKQTALEGGTKAETRSRA